MFLGLEIHSNSFVNVLGSIACCNGDTWASELATVMTVQQPRLLTQPFKVVPRGILPRFLNYLTYWISNGFFKKNHAGTNGGVTIVGVVLSAAGGLMIGFSFYVVLLLCKDSFILEKSADQWPLVLVGLFGGAIGSLIDSFLGAIFQYSGTLL